SASILSPAVLAGKRASARWASRHATPAARTRCHTAPAASPRLEEAAQDGHRLLGCSASMKRAGDIPTVAAPRCSAPCPRSRRLPRQDLLIVLPLGTRVPGGWDGQLGCRGSDGNWAMRE